MKRATALKMVGPLFLVGLLIGVSVSGQQQAKVESPKKVKQGSEIVFQIATDKPSSVPGGVAVQIVSGDGTPVNSSSSSIGMGQKVNVGYSVPFNAKLGKWKVSKVLFYVGGIVQDLTPKGDLTFEVTPHDPLILPSQADVEIQ